MPPVALTRGGGQDALLALVLMACAVCQTSSDLVTAEYASLLGPQNCV